MSLGIRDPGKKWSLETSGVCNQKPLKNMEKKCCESAYRIQTNCTEMTPQTLPLDCNEDVAKGFNLENCEKS